MDAANNLLVPSPAQGATVVEDNELQRLTFGWRRGIGGRLVQACLGEARSLGIERVFALTYRPDFFGALGFRRVDKSELPHKVWQDCVHCAKFPDCDEVAVMREIEGEGELSAA